MDDKENVKFNEQIRFEIIPYDLFFKKPAKTSRDTLVNRKIYFLKAFWENQPETFGLGECSPIYGLSPENENEVLSLLKMTALRIEKDLFFNPFDIELPAIRFAFETSIFDLINGGKRVVFRGFKQDPIAINGLVWMNEFDEMRKEVFEKIESGFNVVKLKIGGIQFRQELDLLKEIRLKYSPKELTIRLDANGSFAPNESMQKLEQLAVYDIHSIEQPIKSGNKKEMKYIVTNSPIPIALDEELIGIANNQEKEQLLSDIKPNFIVLKPSLHGGLAGAKEWIDLAEKHQVNWWVTSMLESSVGLNCIAQWTGTLNQKMHHGLGTGTLYQNNLPAPWIIDNGFLKFIDLSALEKFTFDEKAN